VASIVHLYCIGEAEAIDLDSIVVRVLSPPVSISHAEHAAVIVGLRRYCGYDTMPISSKIEKENRTWGCCRLRTSGRVGRHDHWLPGTFHRVLADSREPGICAAIGKHKGRHHQSDINSEFDALRHEWERERLTARAALQQLERRDPASDKDEEDENEEESNSDSEPEGVSDDEDPSHDSQGTSDDEDTDDELREQIEGALLANGIKSVDQAQDDDSEGEELMNDEQMMAVDEQLAEIFRSRTNENKFGKGG
jgi:hypothetical protein